MKGYQYPLPMIDIDNKTSLADRLLVLEQCIGHTPLFELNRVFQKPGVKLLAKLEWLQFAGSVKARPAFQIIKDAIETGSLNEDKILLDASSGNTAIAYAAIGAALGIKVKICLPENASFERKRLLQAFGALIHFTSPFGGTDEAQAAARRIYQEDPQLYFYADQYNNTNNWMAHYNHTGQEIFSQTDGQVTHFVCGLGTTGTFVGTTRKLRELNPNVRVISLQPDAALHGLEGWKHLETAVVPGIYDPSLAMQNLVIDTEEALFMIRKVARLEGLLISPSSAANLVGAIKVAEQVDEGVVVTVFPDNSERYTEVMNELFTNATKNGV
jgi:S-sulfo-L-cysteine synthase (O-acetyl-L-serine-dependent)